MNCDMELDALGLLCPLPVLKIRKRMQGLAAGGVICVEADDPAALIDIPHFCNEQGHELVSIEEKTFPHHRFTIRKAG
jgi:tRNA 2-thiouridine synthesizing protein A